MPQFTGKTLLLTGALGTVGRAMVARYAEEGATIIALDRPDAENPQALLDGIVKGVRYFGCDLNDLAGTEKAVTALAEEVGGIDILINNAAYVVNKPHEEFSIAEYEDEVRINSSAAFVLMRVLPGDPAVFFSSGPSAGKEEIEELRRSMGLDRPIPVQLVRYLGEVATGNLGRSMTTGQPVVLDMTRRLPASLELTCTALFIALVAAFWKGRVTFWTVAAAGIASAVTYRLAGPPWHVAAGALCGLLAAWLAAGAEERPVTKEAEA